ncbi:MAG: hypothetical protein OXT65_12655 [Alphaproteobacteria bacterium]|nr:hypothetical protein [Alphaproteobacteria bacterium]
MTYQELGAIISKTFSLYTFVLLLPYFSSGIFLHILGQDSHAPSQTSSYFIARSLSLAVMAILFWHYANPIGKVIAGKNTKETEIPLNAETLMTALLAFAGCITILKGLSYFASIFSNIIASHNARTPTRDIISAMFYLVPGLFLIFGARGIGQIILSMRGMRGED